MTVVHAAAGGPGQKLTQPVKARGGTVIGIVSGERKAGTARRAGADRTVVSTGDAFAEPVLELTGGVGADVVLDGGGATTFHASMNVLRRHGLLLYYGPLIGEVPVVTMRDLPRRIKISYPVFSDHVPTREALLRPPARSCSAWSGKASWAPAPAAATHSRTPSRRTATSSPARPAPSSRSSPDLSLLHRGHGRGP